MNKPTNENCSLTLPNDNKKTMREKIVKIRQFELLLAGASTLIMILLTIVGFFGVRTMNSLEGSMQEITRSVNDLNVTMGRVVGDQNHQRRDLDRHEAEIKELQQRFFSQPK